jgi:SAM-dependent methyltransferase
VETLKDLYDNHFGKVSQKCSTYFNQYEEKFSKYRKFPIKLFEIGIENGGSLEIFSKYFPEAELILGCDKDKNCEKLQYDETNIKTIIGDANNEEIKNEVIKHSKFDVIIDDASHGSIDTVSSFCNYFNYLKDDGLFVIDDLCCSYWKNWDGGIFYPLSSINFFKKLVDIINHEHWGVDRKKNWLLQRFALNSKIDLEKLALDQIHSIEFVNSLCFIKKKPSEENKFGNIIIAGKNAAVNPKVLKVDYKPLPNLNESKNPWSNEDLFPEKQVVLYEKKVEQLEKQVLDLKTLNSRKEIKNSKFKKKMTMIVYVFCAVTVVLILSQFIK